MDYTVTYNNAIVVPTRGVYLHVIRSCSAEAVKCLGKKAVAQRLSTANGETNKKKSVPNMKLFIA